MTPFEVIAFALLGFIVIALAGAGGVLLWVAGQERRTIETLACTPCPACRAVLGKAAVNEGRLRSQQASLETQAEDDEPRAAETEHLLSAWTIVCPQCRSELRFDVARRGWLSVQHPHQAE